MLRYWRTKRKGTGITVELSLRGATDMAPELREPSHQQPGDPASGLRPGPKVGQDSETIFYPLPTFNLTPFLCLKKDTQRKLEETL